MRRIDPNHWSGRRALVTGHMGFKGAWLCAVLSRLGAQTWGFGRDERERLLYRELAFARHTSVSGDVNDVEALRQCLRNSRAEVLFHLAAQAIVLDSYREPLRTFATNVIGTATVLEAARAAPNLKAIIVVTSDKVYRNDETRRAFAEDDPLGGRDPYSASKAAAEIATAAMAASFFSASGAPRIATVRAGNVIGGGDWAAHRLLPDAARALGIGEPLTVRNPQSVRPWQHVLDPLAGYLLLAETLAGDSRPLFSAWNFGPDAADERPVAYVADLFVDTWGGGARWVTQDRADALAEADYLAVDASRAQTELGWMPRWRVHEAVIRTAQWYRDYRSGVPAGDLVIRDVDAFLREE